MLSLRVHRLIDPRLSLSVTGHTGLLTGLCVYVCGIDAFTFLLKCIFVSVYECAPIYIYIHTHLHIIYTYVHTHVVMYLEVRVCLHAYTNMRM